MSEVGMIVVVDDGDEENVTMPHCALGMSAGSGDSKVLLVCTEQSYSSSFLPQQTPPGRYCSHAPHHKEGSHSLEESVRPNIFRIAALRCRDTDQLLENFTHPQTISTRAIESMCGVTCRG